MVDNLDLPPVHPGPTSDQILVLQGDHRSAYVWEGHLVDQTLRARRPDDLWDFLRERAFHPRVVERLITTGFYRIFEIGRLQLDWSLITALIERWRPEMHTFHLPTREATIMLQDVQVLYGLRVDGLAVALPHYQTAYGGIAPRHYRRDRGSPYSPVHELDELPQYSWGAAVLAYLYRSMCRASMGTQPPLPPLELGVAPPFLPLARRWVLRHGNYRGSDAHRNLPLVRDVLDMLEARQFIRTPYNDELLDDLPDYCSVDRLLWSIFVPMMCLNVVEHHAIERVLRQFDRPQTIPRESAGWLHIISGMIVRGWTTNL
ncbi:PREDICTED: serine/threonine-protein phosphatase 7 long form homolog [Nicotiana attenuata]|uniref:serine/threonine-protein phosphatase 7 long form homolog n=1 Tax=Nicotiana attenuata TaxID=49451 RepID=UPI000904CDF4|nr:PREDICTED: serine/threonine-protein phosphatase 7 long form homolog [Nicotiana attenuata]